MALPFAAPASLSSSFAISYCTLVDLDALAEVYYEAFKANPGNTHWWSPSRESMMAWMRRRMTPKFRDRNIRHFKITDIESGDLVAWSRWDIPKESTHFGEWSGGAGDVSKIVGTEDVATGPIDQADEISASASAVEPAPAPADYPEGSDPAVCRRFFDALSGASDKWYTENMLGLSLICTAPKYHRRGAAKALIAPMLCLADEAGIKAYLEATPEGKPVYEKLGFREVDTLDFDLGEPIGLYQLCVMVREPILSK
ncbi:hypothetical protein JX266_011587 [Neoarthrinium moseri]|nr:hypothetical protein JX266_011587 [Neoarthrinium moseri]